MDATDASHGQAPATQQAGIPGNFITHRAAWREALETAKFVSTGVDRSYWDHELAAFDRSFDRLWTLMQDAPRKQAPAGATELAEADRRAGAAERKLAASKEDMARIEQVRDKMKDQWGVDRRVSFDVVWAEALALKAGTKSDSGVQEDAAWMPLTPELLTAIESGDLGNRFWIAAHNNNEPQIGVYEWRQGRNPHGFKSDLSRYGASEITHVLPYKPPSLPEAIKQGASHDR